MSVNRRFTGSDEAIINYLQSLNGNESEDDAEDDEFDERDDEVQYYRDQEELQQVLEAESEDNLLTENIDDPPLIEPDSEDIERQQRSASNSTSACHARRQVLRKLVWKKKSINTPPDELRFLGTIDYDADLRSIDTKYGFYSYFMTDQILQNIVEETNLYAVQKEPNTTFCTSLTELKNYVGILYYMSVIKYPNTRLYWSNKYGFAPIINCMTVNRFEKLKSYLHFNNNELLLPTNHPNHDKLHKIRPIVDHLNNRFSRFPLEQRLAIDEQMCATKVAHYLKQYLPKKPHKWGFKLYLLCSIYGFAHKFEIYSGNETSNTPAPNEPDLGVTGNVVVRLVRLVPRNVNHIIYFDNYYTSIPLAVYLHKEKIHCLGTVQSNRLPNNKFPDSKSFMKKSVARGTYEEQMTSFDSTDVSVTMWKDNKVVTLLSTYVGAEPLQKICRYDKSEKQKIEITCPQIVKDYNSHMGGVDLLDSYIGRYHITIKSRKWYMRLFHHLLDLAMINSWLAYKKLRQQSDEKICNLGTYRLEVAETLCLLGKKNCEPKRGRPSSSLESEILAKKRAKCTSQVAPVKDIRLDQVSHWPIFCEKSNRCKMPKCTGFTQTVCEKCRVSLCYNKRNNCFKSYHNN